MTEKYETIVKLLTFNSRPVYGKQEVNLRIELERRGQFPKVIIWNLRAFRLIPYCDGAVYEEVAVYVAELTDIVVDEV